MKLRKNLVALVFTLLFCLPMLLPAHIGAQTREWKVINSECVGEGAAEGVATIVGIECVVANFLNIGVTLVGIASFVMLIIGSILYLVSGGNPKTTEAGSNTISYAIRGIIVSISGWIVINFITTFTGVTRLTIFRVKLP